MKKLYLLLVICILCFTACSSKSKNKDLQQKQEVEVTPTPLPNKEYKDDIFSCSYDDSILKIFTDTDNNSSPFICFNDDQATMSDDVLNGTCLFAATQTHSIPYNESKEWMLSDITKYIFNGLFKLNNQTTPTVTEIEDHIYEYTANVNDIEYWGRLFHIDDKTMTVAACRILPDEKQEYTDALKSCYESIKYIKTESIQSELDKLNEKAKEDAKDAHIIESGDLYDSIKSISENPIILIKIKDQYSLSISMDNPKLFFDKCETIFKKVFKQTESVVFSMKSDDNKELVSLTVVAKGSSTYPLNSSLLIFDKNNEKEISSAYAKNKYWQSIDFDNLQKKELQKIKDEFSK